jgi:hypothetical protein
MFFNVQEKDKDSYSEWKQWGKDEQNYPSGVNLGKPSVQYAFIYVGFYHDHDKERLFVDMDYKDKTKIQFMKLRDLILKIEK